MSLLTVKNLTKQFGNNPVIQHLSFSINEGEFVSILGPSGSGKSTLFHLIGGILSPNTGSIQLADQEITGNRGHISYMPQTPSLLPWRTVLQNVLLGQELHGKKDKEKAKEMLQIAGLEQYIDAFPHELSGGMKQRAAFIRALQSPQPVICLDEPFSALDELTRLDMQKWLLSIWEEYRRTILFITHNIEEALFLSDRIIILSNKPANVKDDFLVPFDRPRSEELLLQEDFLHWKKKVHFSLKGSD
ncbi:ABC transporter ATP-binding protein [Cytobacillus sp. FJAT-54145]|uniref:ABC transporter ATP-binding protein n=1 Tax=Cytobacillus spartinae TaxID=3299023 RepID=A0ABW6K8Q6_9BACI